MTGLGRLLAIRRSTQLQRRSGRLANTPLHVLGIALAFVAVGMLVTALQEWLTSDRDSAALLAAGLITATVGAGLWWKTRPGATRSRDVFAAVGWTYATVTAFGALPYVLAGTFAVGGAGSAEQLVNAFFESASGYSASGSTVLSDFESPGRGLMMYRQATQWYGGMGIVVLAVAVLPFLGVGGLDLMTAEAPGPTSDRLAPRVSETAKRLWAAYVLLTIGVAVALFVAPGPSLYDAVAHALTLPSTGGFSPHAASIGHFDSVAVETIVIVGMVIGGISFAHHWRALRGRIDSYGRDPELRTYLVLLGAGTVILVGLLWLDGAMPLATALRAGLFNIVALGTSTGYANASGPGSAGDFALWLPAGQMILLFFMVTGACTGSTSGGIKVMRVQVLFGHSIRSVRHTRHPNAVLPIRHGRSTVSEDIVSRMAGFFVLYLLLVLGGVVAVSSLGGGMVESISGVVSALGNMGPALGEAGPTSNYAAPFSLPARLVLAVYMLIGRLEIFPILLMFAAPARALRNRW